MSVLVAAVVVVGALCLLDLLLTLGVIRRLREHTSLLSAAGGDARPVIGLPVGELPGAFAAVLTTTGELVPDTTGLRMIAFFSASCSTCPEKVPPFMDYLSAHRMARESVLAVVANRDGAPVPYLERLAEVTRVCVGPDTGEVAGAFRVSGFPAFCLLGADGTLVASDYDPVALPQPATV